MAMQLHAFGLKHEDTRRPPTSASVPVLQARSIRVLWAAWCDALITYSSNLDGDGEGGEPWVLLYTGTGLTAAQKESLTGDADLKRAIAGVDKDSKVVFFGSSMHDGLRGYVVKSGDAGVRADDADQKVVLFGTDVEMEDVGVPEVQSFLVSETASSMIIDVKIGSEGCVLLYTKERSTTRESIMRFADFAQFRRWLSSGEMDGKTEVTSLPYESHDPPQCVMNAATVTAVDIDMHVWTSTKDPRYPRCLGRLYDGGSDFAPLPYFSESYVTKIASGGYMNAALNSDGELFLWGQACPGAGGELDVLKDSVEVDRTLTGISVNGEQDEFVKCLDVQIDGQEATVYDVAVGYGHILVAAEMCETGGDTKRALFAAGDNSGNQLGLGTETNFKETFEEVTALRGKRIVQLVAAGWSTYVVSLEE